MRYEADADAGHRLRTGHRHADLFRAATDLLGHHERTDDLRLGKEDDELVAAVPVGAVGGTDRVADHGAKRAKDLVATQVAAAVVDRLQPVQVDHEHAEATIAATGTAHLLLEGHEQLSTVEEAGQRIGPRLLDRARHCPTLVPGVGDGHEGQEPGREEADREAQRVLSHVAAELGIDEQDGGERGGGQPRGGQAGARSVGQRSRHRDERKQHGERRRREARECQEAGDEPDRHEDLGERHQAPALRGSQELVEDQDGDDRGAAEEEDLGLIGQE